MKYDMAYDIMMYVDILSSLISSSTEFAYNFVFHVHLAIVLGGVLGGHSHTFLNSMQLHILWPQFSCLNISGCLIYITVYYIVSSFKLDGIAI